MDKEHCEVCEVEVSEGIARYSLNTFKKILCMKHQREEREKTYPPRLAKFLNKNL